MFVNMKLQTIGWLDEIIESVAVGDQETVMTNGGPNIVLWGPGKTLPWQYLDGQQRKLLVLLSW